MKITKEAGVVLKPQPTRQPRSFTLGVPVTFCFSDQLKLQQHHRGEVTLQHICRHWQEEAAGQSEGQLLARHGAVAELH